MGVRRLAACGAVEDALAGEAVEALDRQVPPGDAAGEDDRPRPQDVAAVEVHLMGRGVDARDRPRDEDLGAEPARLLERPARQLVARHARGEAEVVLDPGGRARLAAGCLALDHDRPEPLGRAVHGGCQAGGPGTDDHRVVLRGRRLGRDVEELGHPTQLRSHDGLAVHDANGGEVALGRQRARPLLRIGGHVRLEPSEPDLVAVEEAPQLRAGGVQRWPRTIALNGAGADARACRPLAPPSRLFARRPTRSATSGATAASGLVVVQLDPEDARRLRCAEPAGVEHSERDRHLPEDVAGLPLADHALHAVDEPDHLDPTLEDAEQRPLVTLVHGVLARRERDVRRHPGKPVAFGRLEVREHRDPTDLLRRHHEMHHGRTGVHRQGAGFLCNGALSTYEKVGFVREIRKHRWVVVVRVARAKRATRTSSLA